MYEIRLHDRSDSDLTRILGSERPRIFLEKLSNHASSVVANVANVNASLLVG